MVDNSQLTTVNRLVGTPQVLTPLEVMTTGATPVVVTMAGAEAPTTLRMMRTEPRCGN